MSLRSTTLPGLNVVASSWIWLPVAVPKAWQTTSKRLYFGLYATAGSPAMVNFWLSPGTLGSLVVAVRPGTKDSGAHVVPPLLE